MIPFLIFSGDTVLFLIKFHIEQVAKTHNSTVSGTPTTNLAALGSKYTGASKNMVIGNRVS